MNSNKQKKQKLKERKFKSVPHLTNIDIKSIKANEMLRIKKQKKKNYISDPERKEYFETKEYLSNIKDFNAIGKNELTLFISKTKMKDMENPHNRINTIIDNKSSWLKNPLSYIPKSKNPDKQFYQFVRYIFCKYDVPNFFDNIWDNGYVNKFYLNWFIEIGQGKNIRKCKNLPIPLTKKRAYLFLQAPKEYHPLEAIRYAQIIDMGGNKRICDAVIKTSIAKPHENLLYHSDLFLIEKEIFWESLFRFFINNPFLDPHQYGPIIDYINFKKYGEGNQPNFSMHHRDPDALIRDMERWHKELGRIKADDSKWEKSRFNEFYSQKLIGKESRKLEYTIQEITTKKALIEEGKEMRHCVASYASSCKRGECSIWSLKKITETKKDNKIERLATIALTKHGSISQIRGKYNSIASDEVNRIIKQWKR